MESMQDNSTKRRDIPSFLYTQKNKCSLNLAFYVDVCYNRKKNMCLEDGKMSKFHMETVECPKCHSHFRFKVWDSVNVDLNREEKEKILDGTFYDTNCPFCHTKIHGIYGFLYHDMKHKYLVSVRHDYSEAMAACGIPKDYKLRKVQDICQLAEKINIFDIGLNDIVIELVKRIVRDTGKINCEILFAGRKNGELFFQTVEDHSCMLVIKDHIYSLVIKSCMPGDLTEKFAFMEVDERYADELLKTLRIKTTQTL